MITRLRELREEKNISQEEAAKTFKMGLNTYARYERGEREIRLIDAVEIADYYNVSLDHIAKRKKKFTINSEDKKENINELYEELPEEDKKIIKQLIKRLKN